MITILTISFYAKEQARKTFFQEAETTANLVDFACQQEIRKLDLAIKAVLSDDSLATSFHYDLKNTLNFRCRSLSKEFGLTLLAFFTQNGTLSSFYAPPVQKTAAEAENEHKISLLLKTLQLPHSDASNQTLATINDQLYLLCRAPLVLTDDGMVGSFAFVIPFPSETFFNDIYANSSGTVEVAFWRGTELLAGSPTMIAAPDYRRQRPTQKKRALRLANGSSWAGISYPQLELAATTGIVDLVSEIMINTTPEEERINQIITLTVATVLVAILIFSLILFTLGHYIVKPLRSITQATKDVIEKGTLPEYKPMQRRDEIGYLWSVGAKMAATLHQEKIRAEEANRAKSEFLANMSHEIRTPLNAILGFTQILQEHPLNQEEKTYLNYISESGHHLLQIINEILDIAKIESGSMLLEELDFDLNQLLDEVAVIIRGHMKPEIEYRLPRVQGLPRVCGDELKLKQVLINLINNASKFTDKGTIEIQVTVKEMDEKALELLFFVRDTGKGIALENQPLVFQSFTQEDSSITRKYGGTGLGLTISKKIVELMGGRMWLESEPGKGTTFYFTVRLARSHKPAPSPAFNPASNLMIQDCKIAVVDDNPLNILIIDKILRPYGARVSGFATAEEFLNHLKNIAPADCDLIISDIQMPKTSGIELLTLLRAQGCKTPVIAASSENILKQNLQNKFEAFIYKPIIKDELLNAIAGVLAQPTPGQPAPSDNSLYQNLRILVAEDNKINQMLIKKILGGLKPRVLTLKADGRATLEEALKEPYDLVLMDINMPIMDGLTATREIRKTLPELPIYALTANTMSGDREKCLNAGMNGFLEKPINPDHLKEILQRYV
ncbi:MAG: response regulator [Deltaproteobacteria bacterium]|nr:response regulator [Deltaproteobacteria bacterium]